ncbi:hypothetical protein VaNZ11_010327, partial [Volvox africanus]
RPGQGSHGSGKPSRRQGGGASDTRKGGKTGVGGGSGAVEGGAMATAVMQKKAVGGISPGVEAQVRLLLQELHRQELLHHHQHHQQQQHQQQHCQQHQYQRHQLQRGGGGDTDGPSAAPLAVAVDNRTLTAFSALWDQLLAAGFGAEQIKRVVPELPRAPHALVEVALDWLCLHLPASELPQKFKSAGSGGAAYGAAPVRILALAQQQQQQQQQLQQSGALAGMAIPGPGAERGPEVFPAHAEGRSDGLWDDSGPSSSGSGSGSGSEGEATEVVAEAEAMEEDAAGKDEGRTAMAGGADGGGGRGGGRSGGGGGGMKEWILRYMDEQASSDDEGRAPERQAPPCSSVADFEWEMWGDPREVARRRAERARSRLPIEERRRQLAEEWGQAKEAAARAKATGDKARQKDAGLMIRDLKQEMATLGVTEQQLDQVLGGPPGGTVVAAATAAAGKAAQQRPGSAAVAVAAAAAGKDKSGRQGQGKAQAGVNASKDKEEKEKDKGGKGPSKGGKDKGGKDKEKEKEKERGKGKERGGKDKDGGQGKEKGKRKGKGRRAASPPPPPSSSSEPDSEVEAETETEATATATASAATGTAAGVSQHRGGSETEDDVVPDSWEERDPGPGIEPAAAAAPAAAAVIAAAGDGHREGSANGGEICSVEGTVPPGYQQVGGAGGEADGAAVAVATDGGVSVSVSLSGGKDARTSAEATEAAEPLSLDLSVDVGEGLSPLNTHTQDVVAADEEEEENAGKVTTAAPLMKAAADGDAGYSFPGLFDDDGTDAQESSTPATAAPPSALLRAAMEAPGPLGEYGSSGAGGKAGGGKAVSKRSAAAGKTSAAPVPVDAPKPPRALLSQLCQKLAWSQPRFERLTAAAAGSDGSGGFRYNVVLDLGPARGLAKKRNLYGIRVYGVPPARVQQQPDGGPPILPTWPDPSTAQDAAAARALYEVAPALQLQQSMFQSLAPQWRQLWLEW